MICFHPFPVRETDRLVLRRIEHKDIEDFFQMRSDAAMHEYTDSVPDKNIEETMVYINRMNNGVDDDKWIIWAIEHKQSKKVIGSISIWNINKEQRSAELGFGMISQYQGQGLMKEALLSVTDYAFNSMHFKIVDAYTEQSNLKSKNLLESCKFEKVNEVDDQGCYSNQIYHMIVYRLETTN